MNPASSEREDLSTDKLFVYGIFLDERNRRRYGMTNPVYDTVLDYVTVGDYIVEAKREAGYNYSLAGLVVDVDPVYWDAIDMLESAYDRIRITTMNGEHAWMYVGKRWKN